MNKKGFTLVEILATISILAIVIVLVSTKGFGAFDTAKKEIDKLNEEAIVEGIEILKVEIENCDDNFNEELISDLSGKCSELYDKLEEGINIDLQDLISAGYVKGDAINKINAEKSYNIKLKKEEDSTKINYEIDYHYKILAKAVISKAKSITEEEMKNKGYAKFGEPITTPGQSISNSNEAVLATTQDDYGTTYYFRGNVKDNYVNFMNMCWRIVRINGDESIKLILEDQDNNCKNANGNWNISSSDGKNTSFFGAKKLVFNSNNYYIADFFSKHNWTTYPSALIKVLKNFQDTKMNESSNLLQNGGWCYDDNIYDNIEKNNLLNPNINESSNDLGTYYYYNNNTKLFYGASTRLNNDNGNIPSLVCEKDINGNTNLINSFDSVEMKVGLLTADEVAFAGGIDGKSNDQYYLINNYQKTNSLYFWTISPYGYSTIYKADFAYTVGNFGQLYDRIAYNSTNNTISTRPVISLIKNIEITGGNGTKNDPYVIKQ